MTLEDKLFEDIREGKEIELERALLIASGCDTEEKVAEYQAKLDELDRKFKVFNFFRERDKEWTAYSLNKFIWSKKGRKYSRPKFRLNEVIDALLTGEKEIGNCLGLTCLYTILGLRNRLDLSILNTPLHVYSSVSFGNTFADIENAQDDGYGKKLNPNAQETSIKCLISHIFISRGSEIERTQGGRAAEFYRLAYTLSPNNFSVITLFATHLTDIGLYASAIEVCKKIIQKDHNYAAHFAKLFAKPFAKRAELTSLHTELALEDIDRAIELEPLNPEYFAIKGNIYWQAAEYKKARKQYSRVLELDPTDARGYYGIGRMELAEGNLDKGIENLEMALMWDSQGFERAYGCVAKAYRQRAKLSAMFGEDEKAMQDLKRVGELEVEQEQIAAIDGLKSEYQ